MAKLVLFLLYSYSERAYIEQILERQVLREGFLVRIYTSGHRNRTHDSKVGSANATSLPGRPLS